MFKLVIFDLDGTLFHSNQAIAESMNIAFGKAGLGPYAWDRDIARFFGMPFRQWVDALLKEEGRYSDGAG